MLKLVLIKKDYALYGKRKIKRVLKYIFVALGEKKLLLVPNMMFTNKPEVLGTESFLAFGLA